MNSQKNNNALSKAILSIVFSLVIYLLLLASLISNFLSRLPDIVFFVIANAAFMFAIPGAAMAISAKKNNIKEKKSVIYISAVGMLISIVDIFLFIIVLPVLTSAILFKEPMFTVETIGLSFVIGFIVAIKLFIAYRQTKPKKY